MTTLPRRPLRTFTLAASAAALAALALAAPASADEVVPAPLADPGELHVLDRTNLARTAAGCAPLVLDQALTLAADRHTADMVASSVMSHTGTDGSSPRTRLAAAGVFPSRTAENVAVGYDAAGVVDAWLASPGHRANLLDCRLTTVGISEEQGAAGSWWTQVLAG
ncbi:CAP domain-containing protein [Kineococcus sp. SYSU DK001]|uniref:CAP domain-containing protein n=1 Tax=Kineococcus sp. SYSU DK001 TaxID=3383122 RepID=UPI003D7E4B7D